MWPRSDGEAVALPAIDLSWRRLAAGAALATMVVAGLLMAAGAAARHYGPELRIHDGLPSAIRGPLYGLDLPITGTDFVLLCAVMGACYLAVLALSDSVSVRAGLGTIVALHLILALAPPLLSSDVFNYIGYARLDVVHHLNPYEHPLAAAPDDPSFRFIGWPLHTTAYGPLFTLATLPLGGLGFAAALWTLKALAAVASLGCVALVWKCAERLGRDPLPAALFFGLNPVLLIFAVGGAHNDALMMLVALAGVYALLAGREAGVVGIVGAAAVKLSAGVLLPFALLGSRRPARAAIWAGGAIAALAALSLLVFGTEVTNLVNVLSTDARLATPNDIPGVVNDLLGLGLSTEALGRIGMLIFVPALAWLMIRVYRGADWLDSAGWATLALLATTTWLLPWYLAWFLPLAALARRPHQRVCALVLTALILGLQLPQFAGR